MRTKFSDLENKIITDIIGGIIGDDQLIFKTDNGCYKMHHSDYDCCERVSVEEIVGDFSDLIGLPILKAEEVTYVNENPDGVMVPSSQDCFTWTFYKLSTIKGSVTIRWYGESNGYYSERVYFDKIGK